jgi:flavin reductase (DIM6/NTAB) family NADH-FMN oxidoreductase RutF
MSQAIADLCKRLTCGVYVVGVAAGEVRNAFTAAWVMPVSFDPLLIAVSISPLHVSYAQLKRGGVFSVNVLGKHQAELARHFGTPSLADKLVSIPWRAGRSGAPLLDDSLAWFDCEVAGECPAGDHVLVIGKVLDGALLQADAEPLTYRDTGNMDGAAALYPDALS